MLVGAINDFSIFVSPDHFSVTAASPFLRVSIVLYKILGDPAECGLPSPLGKRADISVSFDLTSGPGEDCGVRTKRDQGGSMRRVLMLAATVAIPVAGLAVAVGGGPAWAKGPNGKLVCSSIAGNASGIQITGCSDKGSATGVTNSAELSETALATGGTVPWNNGTHTVFGSPTLTTTSAKKCPGYIKSTPKAPYSGPEPSADNLSGSVTGDTAGLKVPGTYKGEVCISNSGNVTSPKPLKIS